MAIPSMTVADGVAIVSAEEPLFPSSLARMALLVFRSEPSTFASAQGTGPRGYDSISRI